MPKTGHTFKISSKCDGITYSSGHLLGDRRFAMRKRWIVFSILAGLLAAGLVGGVVLAQSADDGKVYIFKEPGRSDILARVAEILDVEQGQVEDAFKQATRERAEQKSADLLAKLVETGVLTQDEADANQAWLDARPEILDFPGFRGYGAWSYHGKGFHRFGGVLEGKTAEWLAKLVEKGHITQEQADAYQAWLDDRPEIDFASLKGKDRYGERGGWHHGKEGYGFGGKR